MEKMTNYFRSALAVQTMKQLDFKQGDFWTVPETEVLSGQLNSQDTDALFQIVNKERKPKELKKPILCCSS